MTIRRFLPICSAIAVVATAIFTSLPAHAQLLGATVTGSLQFGGGSTNYFNPSNGFVPNGYTNKTSGTTLLISDPGIEFGFADGSNTDSADFTDSLLTVKDVVSSGIPAPWKMTFTSTAFSGMNLSKLSDSFNNGVTGSLVGDTLTVNWGGVGSGNTGTKQAVFSLTSAVSAVPEAGTLALALPALGIVGAVLVRRRKK